MTGVVERWGYGQQLDAIYIARRLNLGILCDALLGTNTAADPAQRKLLNDWIVDSMPPAGRAGHLPGQDRQRNRRMAEHMAELAGSGSAAPPVHDGAQLGQLLAVLEAPLTSALVWTLLLLSEHQRVLADVHAELRNTPSAGDGDAPLTMPATPRLPLLGRVIRESLRLLPPHCLGLRQTRAPAELLGYRLAAGTTIIYSPYHTHRTAALFFAPRRFRPERWLYITPTPDEYLPLALVAGTVTEQFLVWHLTLVLAPLLERVQLALAAGARVDYRLHPVLMPKGDLPMIVAPLQRRLIQREVHGTIRELVDFGAT